MTDALWTTRDGTKMRVKDMDDGHLRNTLRLLIRGAVSRYAADVVLCLGAAENLGGEMAQRSAEGAACDLMENQSWRDFVPPIYRRLVAEAKRRDIKDYEYPDEKVRAAQDIATLRMLRPGVVERVEDVDRDEAAEAVGYHDMYDGERK